LLCSFLTSKIITNPEFIQPFEFVDFASLSLAGISEFLDKICVSELDFFIQRKLLFRLRSKLQTLLSHSVIQVEFNGSDRLDGIIRSLTEAAGANTCDEDIIEITANQTEPRRFGSVNGGNPRVVVDLDSDVGWYDNNQNQSWLQFDFKDRKICISSYTIKFATGTSRGGSPARWIVEGSDDLGSWTVIDNRENYTGNFRDHQIENFECSSKSSQAFRYVRILVRIHEFYWGGNYQMAMTAIEFFGQLRIGE